MSGVALVIVLGRAGSKGVPGKNMRPVAGRPCARWTIECAQRSPRAYGVLVSSDDPRLLELASAMDCLTHHRSAATAGDGATVDAAAREALAHFDSLAHRPVHEDDPIVLLYANVPVRPADIIDRALGVLTSTGCDSVQSYAPVGKHHPWWTARLGEDGIVTPWEGDVLNHGVYRRQDLPAAFVPDGGVIALTRRALMGRVPGCGEGPHAFLGVDRRGFAQPEGAVIDIDSEADLLVADAALRALHSHPHG